MHFFLSALSCSRYLRPQKSLSICHGYQNWFIVFMVFEEEVLWVRSKPTSMVQECAVF